MRILARMKSSLFSGEVAFILSSLVERSFLARKDIIEMGVFFHGENVIGVLIIAREDREKRFWAERSSVYVPGENEREHFLPREIERKVLLHRYFQRRVFVSQETTAWKKCSCRNKLSLRELEKCGLASRD